MDADSDSERDNRDAAAASNRANTQNKITASPAAEAESATTTTSTGHITRRKRLEEAKEAGYASHIASLQNVQDLPSGWISATRAVKRRSNGKFRRPDEEPPITGYSWNTQHGVWVPSIRLVQETSLMSKISTKKASGTSTSRSKPPPSSTTVHAPPTRSKPFLKWATTDDDKEDPPSTVSSAVMMEQKTSTHNARLKSKSSPDGDITIEPCARASRKRSTSQTTIIEEKPPPRSNRRETKSAKLYVESDHSDDEASDDDVLANESNEEAVPIDTKATPENVGRKRSHKKKVTTDVKDHDENEFHPNSMWQEPFTDDLTLYERHRIARPIPKGTILFHMDAIRPEIRCAICLDILQNTRIVRECLHRFCESCIEQALTFQNVEGVGGRRKECPICRVYIPSRRSLAPDTYMDTLISRLLDNLIWEEDNDPAIYLRSPQKSKQGLVLQKSELEDNDIVDCPVATGGDDTRKDQVMKNELGSLIQLDVVEKNVDETAPVPMDTIPELIKVVLIQAADPVTKKKHFPDLQQPYLTLASDAPGSLLKSFIYRKHGYVDTTTSKVNGFTSHEIRDKETTKGISDPNLLLLWTIYRLEPYLINANVTLQYLLLHQTDPFQGRYMPIYYRYTGR